MGESGHLGKNRPYPQRDWAPGWIAFRTDHFIFHRICAAALPGAILGIKTLDREELRQEIREKRRELAYLFRSDTPDKKLIDQKILELSRLEAELDEKMVGSNNRR